MKMQRFLFIIPLISLCGCTSYNPKKLDPNVTYDNVYLIMGQSNASGISQHAYLKDSSPELYQKYTQGNDKVLISYDCDQRIEKNYVPVKFGFGNTEEFFGPEIGISEVLSQKEETSYIIKATWSGSCLMTEYVSNKGTKLKHYKRFIRFIDEQLETLKQQGKKPRVRGVFWMQGESDSFLEDSNTYYQAESYFLKYLRHDLNDYIYDHFNYVDAYIKTGGICWVNPEIINDCKQRLADENDHCYCIKTNGEDNTAINLILKSDSGEDPNDLAHYDSKSMILLGKTAGEYLIK